MMKRIFFLFLTAILVFSSYAPILGGQVAAAEGGTTYYVSTLNGRDSHSGTAKNQAFYSLQKINDIELQPGDRVLLEAGSVFIDGYLHLQGSGSEEAPIIIDRYGEGDDPAIQTNGQGIWYQNYGTQLDNPSHKRQGYVSSSILLYDVEYIEINNLEISNDPMMVGEKYSDLNKMNRTGVAAVAQNKGTIDHIYLNGLNIHNIRGNVYDKHMNNGGIYFTVFKPLNEAKTGISRYNDIVIENNTVNNVSRWGIAVGYTAYFGPFSGKAAIPDETIAKYGSSNVIIRNNYIKDAGGDAITAMYLDRPLIEYNVADGAAKEINDEVYQTGFGKVAAGIWPWKSKNAVFQYNEVFDTHYNQDGQAWDADSGDGTIYQYNYSHNNAGGAIMICLPEAINSIFRYNISQNDLSGVLNLPSHPKAHFYNNVFYIKEGVPFIRTGMTGGTALIENNIIYNAGALKSEDWIKGSNMTYSHNLYYNYENIPNDPYAVTEDPQFVDPGTGPIGIMTNMNPKVGNVTHNRDAFNGYQLQATSPAIGKGKYIENNGGQDFFGNELIGAPDIGAYQSNIEMENGHNQILAAAYIIDENSKSIFMPMLENNPTTVEEVKHNVAVYDTAKVKIFNGENEVNTGTVSNGMFLKVVAENGEENSYTLKEKNTYQYALDFTKGQQGNVWYAQKKVNQEYMNMANFSAQYPTWEGSSWAAVGLQGAIGDAITENTHGLLVDSLTKGSGEQGHSMAFRAPKTGEISLTFKDNEPYLRQASASRPNQNGDVKLLFTLNGEQLQEPVTLPNDGTSLIIAPQSIQVSQGDYVRIEIVNEGTPSIPSVYITPLIEYQDPDSTDPGEEEVSAESIKTLVESFEQDGGIADERTARQLKLHLTAVALYEEKGEGGKVVKHMEAFVLLLEQQLKNEAINLEAYTALKNSAEALILKWSES
ncbi:FIMAH domain-containing protein [Sporosarcina sp. NPDC096371]|uniref:FIMAH domain-containing protein n=1 Tax=Sporosarcina sp. NPDC096371 TaxID=3364530 RepID=UPI003818A380